MKTILHLQIPIDESKSRTDSFKISPDILGKFMALIKKTLNESGKNDVIIIASPTIPSISPDSGQTFYNFDMNQINVEELMELIKK